jgi:hypothetical protein
MTDRRAALVKSVCDAMHEADQFYVSYDQAIAAIDLIRAEVLEEAAKVADATTSYDDNLHKSVGAHTTGQRIAAAIRALKEAPCSSS